MVTIVCRLVVIKYKIKLNAHLCKLYLIRINLCYVNGIQLQRLVKWQPLLVFCQILLVYLRRWLIIIGLQRIIKLQKDIVLNVK